LAGRIRAAPARLGPVRLVAVDGPGGAGKSIFAERLSRALGGRPIVHTDDFSSWEEPLDWWWRLEEQCLAPLAHGEVARFLAYDWGAHRRSTPRVVPPAEVVVLEGVSSARSAVADRLSLVVFVDAPADVRLARGLARDGDSAREQWLEWMREEDEYFAADPTRERAGVVVDGAPTLDHDPESSFVQLRSA
jgi:uridine kinase